MADPRDSLIAAMKELGTKKSIDKITVSEILKLADVSRQTFYRFFQDKYELAFAVYEQDVGRYVIEHYDETKDFDGMNRIILSSLKQNASFYRNMFRDQSPNNAFLNLYHAYCVEEFTNMIGRRNLTKERAILMEMWFNGVESLMIKWVLTGMREDEEVLVDIYHRFLPYELHPFVFKNEL